MFLHKILKVLNTNKILLSQNITFIGRHLNSFLRVNETSKFIQI